MVWPLEKSRGNTDMTSDSFSQQIEPAWPSSVNINNIYLGLAWRNGNVKRIAMKQYSPEDFCER